MESLINNFPINTLGFATYLI